MPRRRGKQCLACGIPVYTKEFAQETKYCERCSITLALSREQAITALRSRKLKAKAKDTTDAVEVLSSDEELERQRAKKLEEAEVISDDESSEEEPIPEDFRENDSRVEATDGHGLFEAETATDSGRPTLSSRSFMRHRFRIKDFPAMNLSEAEEDSAAEDRQPAKGKKRPADTKSSKTSSKKQNRSNAEFSAAYLHYIQNPDDYAASDYESGDDDDLDDDTYAMNGKVVNLCSGDEASDNSDTEDEAYNIRERTSRVVPDEPCFLCESKTAPDNSKQGRVQCPDCDAVYHRSCAIEYGKEAVCWLCEDDDLIDDSELTEADRITTAEIFGVFHVKEERVETEDEGDDDNEEAAKQPQPQEEEAVPDASQVKQTILAGWKKFLEDHTAKFDSDFQTVTRAIEASNGFKTNLETDLHKLFQHYTNEQAKVEELEKKKGSSEASVDAALPENTATADKPSSTPSSPAKETNSKSTTPSEATTEATVATESASTESATSSDATDKSDDADEVEIVEAIDDEDVEKTTQAPEITPEKATTTEIPLTTIDLTGDDDKPDEVKDDEDVVAIDPPPVIQPSQASPLKTTPTEATTTAPPPKELEEASPSRIDNPLADTTPVKEVVRVVKPKKRIALMTIPPPSASVQPEPLSSLSSTKIVPPVEPTTQKRRPRDPRLKVLSSECTI
ncbi:hypothetical protein AeMF1_014874 [Aphanomyces euteiches]|nr:hypothetical protein AeMF1_014874 [Aphanomyces euteiches]KAH9188383.1 hypothetical protein AeNC1_009632 [Aphanomyces euteiches]